MSIADIEERPEGMVQVFLSYARSDDEYLEGAISWLREALEKEVRAETGRHFQIFQDIEGIELGDPWLKKLGEALKSAHFFIPILTPTFFTSDFCRKEAAAFLEYEAAAGRDDLILPIYLLEADVIREAVFREGDGLVQRLLERQHCDWRELAFSLRDNDTQPHIAELAAEIAHAVGKRGGLSEIDSNEKSTCRLAFETPHDREDLALKEDEQAYRSDAFGAIHEITSDLYDAGVIEKRTLRQFDDLCLTKVQSMSAKEIRELREREGVSQAVFARYLNVTSGLISQWERGVKHPAGASLKLLTLVKKKGIEFVA